MAKKKSTNNLWLPINLWNLNEVFTTESISPISFYIVRGFGNPVNRNEEKLEDVNYLILFDERVSSEIIIEISPELLDEKVLQNTKSGYSEYCKTIYLRNGLFKVHFNSEEKLQEFFIQQFMLLEVKTVNKYKSDSFIVSENKSKKLREVSYQPKFLTEQSEKEPFFDKAFNQIKGLMYGYIIGSTGSLGANEQGLVSEITKLKNSIGGIHTDIALAEQYTNFWFINIKKQIKDCSNRYFDLFNQYSSLFDTLTMRLQEVDNLNKMRHEELSKQKSPRYKYEYEKAQDELEQARREVYIYECECNITPIKEEYDKIKLEEKKRGRVKNKTREFYKKGTNEYERKQQLKYQIEEFEKNNFEYKLLKDKVYFLADRIKNLQTVGTQFDTSINEQFNRITEQLNDIVKRTNNFFLSKNNKERELPNISFEIDQNTLTNHYFEQNRSYNDFIIQLPEKLANDISNQDIELLKISLNAIISFPQGRLSNYSEENILKIIAEIGKHLPDSDSKNSLRDYYLYRTAKSDNFTFPTNDTLANIIVFFMKVQGHDQINKMLITKGIQHKQIAFMCYGAYTGFANLPKTFTNLIFDSENQELRYFIDDYLFNNYLK